MTPTGSRGKRCRAAAGIVSVSFGMAPVAKAQAARRVASGSGAIGDAQIDPSAAPAPASSTSSRPHEAAIPEASNANKAPTKGWSEECNANETSHLDGHRPELEHRVTRHEVTLVDGKV